MTGTVFTKVKRGYSTKNFFFLFKNNKIVKWFNKINLGENILQRKKINKYNPLLS